MKQYHLFLLLFIFINLSPALSTPLSTNAVSKPSLFQHIYEMEGTPTISINTDINTLIEDKFEEVYQDLSFEVKDTSNNESITINGQIRTRGNMRKKVSFLPPVKLKFPDEILEENGFLTLNNLKLVFPDKSGEFSQELLRKEFLLYQIYSHIDTNYIRTKLVNISILWKGKEKFQFQGFMIEDKAEYSRRKKLQIVDKGIPTSKVFDETCFAKMVFFQYMIANTDWSIEYNHNLEVVKLPQIDKIVAMPYDFDYSGFVGHAYAVPHPIVPINNVNERFFYPQYKLEETNYQKTVQYYLSIEKDLYKICDNADYLKAKTIKKSKAYIEHFFDLLKDSKKLTPLMVKG